MDQVSNSISEKPTTNEQLKHSLSTYISKDGKNSELRDLENHLRYAMEKCRIKDLTQISERMKRIEERVEQYRTEDRIDAIEQERTYLNELKELEILNKKISIRYSQLLSRNIDQLELNELEDRLRYSLEKCQIKDITQLLERIKRTEKRIEEYRDEERKDAAEQEYKYLCDLEQLQKISEEILLRKSTVSNLKIQVDKRTELDNLCDDFTQIPCCAEKTTLELLIYFQQKLLQNSIDENVSESITMKLEHWQEQIQKEELMSKDKTITYFQNLNRYVYNEDCLAAVHELKQILNRIRPLYVQEIQRFVKDIENTARLIDNKDIILLVGITGSGKSTTVQYLTGAKMKDTLVEIAPGSFLEHITVDGPIKNAGLTKVTSSPFSQSETRYITPVTVQLKDILGSHWTGEIILCDSPGFEDTRNAEIDIANAIGVTRALKNCNSVKILALSSYRSLGDRGEGIGKLIKILIDMIHGIECRLDSIFYAFTKYPLTTDICALLSNFKKSKVDEDHSLQSDTAFLSVLQDMIDKTKDGAEKLNPTDGKPGVLIQKLNHLQGIRYPGEVFHFSISEKTQYTISQQIQIYRLSIVQAIKHKDIHLIMYYLNNMKFLNDLFEHNNIVRDAYINSIQILIENIEQYYRSVIEKFARYLIGQDDLHETDIQEYKNAHDYIQQIQILKVHLGSKLVAADILIEKILVKLEKRSSTLREEDLFSSSIGVFLNNLHLLQRFVNEFESYYIKICQDITERFELTLIEPIPKLISSNEFKQIAEIISIISKCLPILNHHINNKVETNYQYVVNLISQHMNKLSKEATSVLLKTILNENDIEILRNYINLSKSIKETLILKDDISKSLEILQYFDQIISRITELFDKNKTHALEDIEHLVIQMELLRTLPDIENGTSRKFHHTIQNIRGYMEQLQREAEILLSTSEHQMTGINKFRSLARVLLRLKRCSWIDRIYPETSHFLIRHIRDELKERAEELEHRLKNFNLSLKSFKNLLFAQEILEHIESMKILEETIPELKEYRKRINDYFIEKTTEVFEDIKKTFNLADNTIDPLKQRLIQFERIKKEYDQLYPARNYLRKLGYQNIDVLNHDIENMKIRQDLELKEIEADKQQMENQLNDYNIPIEQSRNVTLSKTDQSLFDQLLTRVTKEFHRYQRTNSNKTTTTQMQEDYDKLLQSIEEKRTYFHDTLLSLENIHVEYHRLLTSSNSIQPNEKDFLQAKGHMSYESLEKLIEEKTEILIEYEQYKRIYYFNDDLDNDTVTNALNYINHCEKVSLDVIKKTAEETDDMLKKYLEEYGYFLDKEIQRNFKHIINFDKKDSSQYAEDLEKCLEKLFSLDKHSLIFENLHGSKKLEHHQRDFFNYHRYLETEMETEKVSGNYQVLRKYLIISQTLSCIDRFCTGTLSHNRFQNLYSQYKTDIIQESRESYKRIIDYISKDDYGYVDLILFDISEEFPNTKLLNQIKYNLNNSLNKIIKTTKNSTYWLDDKIERNENNLNKIQEITDNIDKIRLVLNRSRIIALIDTETKTNLQKFEHDINQILSTIILNKIKTIELYIDHNCFLEAEQSMENLIRIQRQLIGYNTSKLVDIKTEDIKRKFHNLSNDILQNYDFTDLNHYSTKPPKHILEQLKKVISNGYPKYTSIYRSFIEKIRNSFILAIDDVRITPWINRSMKIRTIKNAFLFLSEELKTNLQLQIHELNELNINDNVLLQFD